MPTYRPGDLGVAVIGALGALELSGANAWPRLLTQGTGVIGTDAALVATGIALMWRQRSVPTAALCLGLMSGKALLLTLAAFGTPVSAPVLGGFTILILLYMAGSLATQRTWVLSVGAVLAAGLTGLGPPVGGDVIRILWFLGLAIWLAAPVWPRTADGARLRVPEEERSRLMNRFETSQPTPYRLQMHCPQEAAAWAQGQLLEALAGTALDAWFTVGDSIPGLWSLWWDDTRIWAGPHPDPRAWHEAILEGWGGSGRGCC